jgi:hypothetical protein
VYALGIGAGTLAFALLFPWLQGLYLAGSAGPLTLPQLLHLPYGLVVFLVVLMALAGFKGAGWIEARFGTREEGRSR